MRPESLTAALDLIRGDGDDPDFFALARSVFDWRWDRRDAQEVDAYAESAQLTDFARVALPQGLVASGFFANIVLLSFDDHLRRAIGRDIAPGIRLADACRYVDDLRLTLTVDADADADADNAAAHVAEATTAWLQRRLSDAAPFLQLSAGKTRVAAFGGDERPLFRQSTRMTRIQVAVSGGFDAFGGEEILDAIQGLVRTQEALTATDDTGWHLTPVPDVRDETVARFAAARFRLTYRSVRPLLADSHRERDEEASPWDVVPQTQRTRATRTRRELDEDAKNFALSLIQLWVRDPSNVRLLRIGLDLWPDAELLNDVLKLLRPFTEKGGRRKVPRRVGWYCLSEIFRAGATETGFVPDDETLPTAVNVRAYRDALRDEAVRVLQTAATIPWYLRQQALLFPAAYDPAGAPAKHTRTDDATSRYWELLRFLRGDNLASLHSCNFATLAVVARRGFVDREGARALTLPNLDLSRWEHIAPRDPAFTLELLAANPRLLEDLPLRVREDLSRDIASTDASLELLPAIVLAEHPTGPLRNELGLLRFTIAFLRQWRYGGAPPAVITPGQVQLKRTDDAGMISQIDELRILPGHAEPSGSLYAVPGWCEDEDRWRFQVGFLLRFVLSGQQDFTRPVRPVHWKEPEPAYRPVVSHWYQRLYGLFSGRTAFGDDWLPISEWMEGLLLALLRWPGCSGPAHGFEWVERGIDATIDEIGRRKDELERERGRATATLMLRAVATRRVPTRAKRALYGCVVQTAIPRPSDLWDCPVRC